LRWSQDHRCCVFAGLLCLAASDSKAGAWLTEAGRTEVIFTSTALDVTRQFTGNGSTIRTGRFTKTEFKVDVEHGLNRDFSLLAGARAEAARLPPDAATLYSGAGALRAGAKVRLWNSSEAVVSLQGWFEAGRSISYPDRTRSWSAPAEGEIRLNAGRSSSLAGLPIFADAQFAYRWRGGNRPDEVHIDITAGVRATPQLMFLLQSFNAVAIAREDGARLRRHKLQPSLVYAFSDMFSLQVGVFSVVAGRNVGRERGALISLWYKL